MNIKLLFLLNPPARSSLLSWNPPTRSSFFFEGSSRLYVGDLKNSGDNVNYDNLYLLQSRFQIFIEVLIFAIWAVTQMYSIYQLCSSYVLAIKCISTHCNYTVSAVVVYFAKKMLINLTSKP